jgi:hypothetical protein
VIHFREPLYKISIESFSFEKLFGRAPPEISLEVALGALPNRAYA